MSFSNAPSNQPTGGYPQPSSLSQTAGKGFFGALFDFSFSTCVTPKIVKAVYILATIGLALGYVIVVLASFVRGPVAGIAMMLVGALLGVLYLALIRMTLEFYYSIVRMSEDIHARLPR